MRFHSACTTLTTKPYSNVLKNAGMILMLFRFKFVPQLKVRRGWCDAQLVSFPMSPTSLARTTIGTLLQSANLLNIRAAFPRSWQSGGLVSPSLGSLTVEEAYMRHARATQGWLENNMSTRCRAAHQFAMESPGASCNRTVVPCGRRATR